MFVYTATNSMKPPAFDIGYGVYRSFYFTEYVPPPQTKTTNQSKDLNQQTDGEEQSNNRLLFYIIFFINLYTRIKMIVDDRGDRIITILANRRRFRPAKIMIYNNIHDKLIKK